jgi:ribosomal protein L24
VLVRKGDTVKVMRGPGKGKEAKVSDVNTLRLKVFVEGVVVKNVRGREVGLALEPSNLLLIALESTKERKEIFNEEAFRKAEAPKKEAQKAEAAKSEPAKVEHAHPSGEHSHEGKEHAGQAPKGSGVHAQTKPAQR